MLIIHESPFAMDRNLVSWGLGGGLRTKNESRSFLDMDSVEYLLLRRCENFSIE